MFCQVGAIGVFLVLGYFISPNNNNSKMKNIAVLVGYFYPDRDASSTVVNRYLQELKSEYSFHVITVTQRKSFKPLCEDNIKVYYISNFLHDIRVYCEDKAKGKRQFFYKFMVSLFRIRTFVIMNFKYPLATKWEINAYYKKLKMLDQQYNFDIVLSVSSSINSQFSALKFKEGKPGVKWITFFTDPFTDLYIYYPPLCNKRKRKIRNFNNEKKILDNADYNILVEDLYRSAIEKFHQSTSKTMGIKFALDDLRARTASVEHRRTDKIKLIYAGMLYKVIRNPEYMLSVLSKVSNITIDMFIVGHECDAILRKYESDTVRVYGRADKEKYDQMICYEYDVLVNIGNNSSNQTPSKTIELISTGRPIINFYYSKDAQYNMIEKYPLGLNIGREDLCPVATIEEFCSNVRGKQLAFEDVENLFSENSLNKQVRLFKDVLEK